jgi:two-component system response regulator
MPDHAINQPINILLVEDSPGDVRLTQEALRGSRVPNHLYVVSDGVEALAFLHQEAAYSDAPRPDLILLDLNLPRKDGREVLQVIKAHDSLKQIPVVVLTMSQALDDVHQVYDLHGNCYITKPVDLDAFLAIIRSIENFWLMTARLPGDSDSW